jgi:hypothetical protein
MSVPLHLRSPPGHPKLLSAAITGRTRRGLWRYRHQSTVCTEVSRQGRGSRRRVDIERGARRRIADPVDTAPIRYILVEIYPWNSDRRRCSTSGLAKREVSLPPNGMCASEDTRKRCRALHRHDWRLFCTRAKIKSVALRDLFLVLQTMFDKFSATRGSIVEADCDG